MGLVGGTEADTDTDTDTATPPCSERDIVLCRIREVDWASKWVAEVAEGKEVRKGKVKEKRGGRRLRRRANAVSSGRQRLLEAEERLRSTIYVDESWSKSSRLVQ